MSDCCSIAEKAAPPKKCTCPKNGQVYSEVGMATVLLHIKTPWLWDQKPQGYYFCEDPDCDVIYFAEDGSCFAQDQVRTLVGLKSEAADALSCYCFGVLKSHALTDSSLREFVIKKTKDKYCACDKLNPSGRCCLKDFPRSASDKAGA